MSDQVQDLCGLMEEEIDQETQHNIINMLFNCQKISEYESGQSFTTLIKEFLKI